MHHCTNKPDPAALSDVGALTYLMFSNTPRDYGAPGRTPVLPALGFDLAGAQDHMPLRPVERPQEQPGQISFNYARRRFAVFIHSGGSLAGAGGDWGDPGRA